MGFLGRVPGQVGPWARACSWGRGGEPRQRWGPSGGRATCQAKAVPGCVWAAVPGLPVPLGAALSQAPTWQASMPPCG